MLQRLTKVCFDIDINVDNVVVNVAINVVINVIVIVNVVVNSVLLKFFWDPNQFFYRSKRLFFAPFFANLFNRLVSAIEDRFDKAAQNLNLQGANST